ncbi:Lateral organ boundaries LOB domain-containing protein [Dioscorea alata]|uniref:Lateral organ boundaries LOB domain-containing protein n=1 Tax=Dioscorea alata TaxID=55571 RepID=A0ACB7WFB4_DIOAL|nr:Lateral organ boundaries LOB domain-containing protein [Dioscorea alata]
MADESSSSSRDSRAACAACNYLRVRCNFDCPLARYFPANRASEVVWVDRHVGLAGFVELVNRMRPELRDQTAESLISKAKGRRRDAVHAAADIAQHLLAKTEATKKELQSVRQHLALLRSQQSPTSSV